MPLMALLRFHAAHGLVESLALHGGMGGYVKLPPAAGPGPVLCSQEKGLSDTFPPRVLRHMDTGQIQVSLLSAEQRGLHRGKAFQGAVAESREYKAPCGRGILQALD